MAATTMPARFASACGCCGLTIKAGAPIRYRKGYAANHEACGDPTKPAARIKTRRRGRARPSYRCTHEDYPCCGCDPDTRSYYTEVPY
jgi:hypothetical protein